MDNIETEILIFRDELKYSLSDTIQYFNKICDSDIITEIYNSECSFISEY
jgi:hypothetical protein